MKLLVLFDLLLFLFIGILISVCLWTYIKELKALPFMPKGSEDPDDNDVIYYVIFWISIFINLLTLSSCLILFL